MEVNEMLTVYSFTIQRVHGSKLATKYAPHSMQHKHSLGTTNVFAHAPNY